MKGNAGQTPEEQLLVQFQGMIAEYERAQITERCRRGKRHRAKTGLVNVLSGAPYGYRYLKKTEGSDSCYVIDENEAPVVRQVYQWYTEEGLSLGAIARRLTNQGVPTRRGKARWERSLVWAMLRNPAYIGRAAYGKTEPAKRRRITRPLRQKGGFSKRCRANRERPREQWIEIAVPALISEPTFARAQERLAQNQRLSIKNTREITLLQGLLVCAECGYALYRTSTRTSKRRAKYYRCLGSDRWRQLMKTPCTCRPIRVEDVDEAVWTQVKRLLEDPFLIRTELARRRDEGLRANPIEQRRHRVEHDIQRVNQQIDKLLDAYQEGLLGLGELRHRMPALRKKQAAAQKELESAHWQALADEQLRQLDQSLETFLGRLKQLAQNLSVADKQKIIRLLVKEIIVEKDAIIVRHCIPVTGNAELKEQLNGQTDQSTYQVCTRSPTSGVGALCTRSRLRPSSINCIGPESDYRRIDHPLVRNLMRRGLIRQGPAHLGVDALLNGAIIGQNGAASDVLYTLGSSMKGVLWEVLAVPEIRVQAERLARLLLDGGAIRAGKWVFHQQYPVNACLGMKIPETPQRRRLCSGMKSNISNHDYELHLGGTAKPGIQKTLGCRGDLRNLCGRPRQRSDLDDERFYRLAAPYFCSSPVCF